MPSSQELQLELSRERYALRSLLEFAQTLRPTLGAQSILKSVVRTIMGKALVSDAFAYFRFDGEEEFELVTKSGFRTSEIPHRIEEPRALPATLFIQIFEPGEAEPSAILGFGKSMLPEAQLDTQTVFLDSLAVLTGIAIANARLFESEKERQRLESELEVAREIQHTLMPQKFPKISRCVFAAHHDTSELVGGDYYDVVKLSDHRVLMVIADVVGKGITAALTMSNMQAALRALSSLLVNEEITLLALVQELNRLMCESTSQERYITAVLCIVDTERNEIESVVCGHPYPYLLQEQGIIEVPSSGIPLGIIPTFRYERSVIPFTYPGGLFLYTDGLSEAFRDGRMLGTEGTKTMLSQMNWQEGADALVISLVANDKLEITDDVTFLTVSFQ